MLQPAICKVRWFFGHLLKFIFVVIFLFVQDDKEIKWMTKTFLSQLCFTSEGVPSEEEVEASEPGFSENRTSFHNFFFIF